MIARWPNIDDRDKGGAGFLAINNSMNEICHGFHIPPEERSTWFDPIIDEVKATYRNWFALKQLPVEFAKKRQCSQCHGHSRTLTIRTEWQKMLRGLAQIVDAMNPVRNHNSLARPNKDLLEAPEAMLVVNAVRSLLHYLNMKLR